MRLRLALAVALALPTPAAAQDRDVLFLGNSYTAGNDLASLVGACLRSVVPEWDDVHVERSTPGGYRFVQHLSDAQGASAQVAGWLAPGAVPWDTVVLQEQSQVPGFPTSEPVWIESRDSVVGLHGIIGEAGADTMLFMTWGRRTGDATNPQLFGDFNTMQDRLRDGYLAYAAAASTLERPVYVAPVGEAFRAVHGADGAGGDDPATEGSRFWDLYTSDGSHPSESGSYLAAGVLIAAMTGRSPVGMSCAPSSVSASRAAELEAIAEAVVRGAPFGDYAFPWAKDVADWTPPPNVEGDGDLVVSGWGVEPLVRIGQGEAVAVALVRVGAAHAAGSGRGRLQVDGSLEAAEVVLAEGDGGAGMLRISGVVGVGALSGGSGDGAVLLEGGELTLGAAVDVALVQLDGVLELGSASLRSWRMDGGRVTLAPASSTSPIRVDGAASLAGTIALVPPADASTVELLLAASVEVASVTWELPDGWTTAVQPRGADTVVIALGPGVSPPPEEVPPVDGAACGCAQGGRAHPGWLVVGLALLRRRGPRP